MTPSTPAFEVLRNLYGYYEPTCVLTDTQHGPQHALETVSLLPQPAFGEKVLVRWSESGGVTEFIFTEGGWVNLSHDEGIHAS